MLIEAVLRRVNDLGSIDFPEDRSLDVELCERWPRQDGLLALKLCGGQDADGVAALLRSAGIRHDYR